MQAFFCKSSLHFSVKKNPAWWQHEKQSENEAYMESISIKMVPFLLQSLHCVICICLWMLTSRLSQMLLIVSFTSQSVVCINISFIYQFLVCLTANNYCSIAVLKKYIGLLNLRGRVLWTIGVLFLWIWAWPLIHYLYHQIILWLFKV